MFLFLFSVTTDSETLKDIRKVNIFQHKVNSVLLEFPDTNYRFQLLCHSMISQAERFQVVAARAQVAYRTMLTDRNNYYGKRLIRGVTYPNESNIGAQAHVT